jgi:hypothetical protein
MVTAGLGLKGFSPGGSPFLAKGIVFLTARAFYEHRVPGGLAAVYDKIRDEPTVAFLEQRFLTGGWYDLFPVLTASSAAARACQMSTLELVRETAKWQAERDLTGIYRMILAIASPSAVAQRLPSLSKQYFNFGDADGKMMGDGAFESNRWGIPAPLEGWFATVTTGYVPVALEKAGARNVKVRWDSTPEGKAHGVPTVRIKFDIRWE